METDLDALIQEVDATISGMSLEEAVDCVGHLQDHLRIVLMGLRADLRRLGLE